jgi:hypothetical protein
MLVTHVSMKLPRARAWSGGGGAHLLARRPSALPLRADEDDVEHLAGMLTTGMEAYADGLQPSA